MTGRPGSAERPVRAVLVDLDDTLFDHRHCAAASLGAVHARHACFRAQPFEALERAHAALLEELHADVMVGRVDVDAARLERFRRLFLSAGVAAGDDLVRETAREYRRAYVASRRAIDGAAALLARARSRAAVIVVSNNVRDEQEGKLRHCGLDRYVDALVVSGEEGISKPDPEIFRRALARVPCEAGEAVMLGDSWAADVAGARAAGIRAVWFNRHALPRPEPAGDVVEIRALEPIDDAWAALFGERPAPEVHANRR